MGPLIKVEPQTITYLLYSHGGLCNLDQMPKLSLKAWSMNTINQLKGKSP